MSEQLISTPAVFGENQNFLLERELGRGGMGGVYLGRDKMLDRTVAVKVMLKEFGSDSEFVEKFKKEAQAAARLIHPNIAQIYSYGISEGMPYIAMELASGGSLYSLMNAMPGKTDIQRTLKICQQVAQALQCASDQGFVHGDVKPENILLDANGNAKLVDFGLAAMQKDTEEIWGTPYYIAPEKVKKEPLDFRADMYSLGGTLYHALTGVAPFEGSDSVAVVKKRFDSTPRKPSEIRPEISPAIDMLVMKMLAFDRNDRFPSFEALLHTFKDVLASGLTQSIPSVPSPQKSAPAAAGGKRVVMRNGRRVMMRGRVQGKIADKVSIKSPISPDTEAPEEKENNDDEENEGSLGAKVALIVVGVILLIAGIAGGLVWYVHHSKVVEEREASARIESTITKAKAAIEDMRTKIEKTNLDLQTSSQKTLEECEKFTKDISDILPEYADRFKPPLPAELIKAIESTNPPPAVVEAPKADTNAAPATAQADAATQEKPKSIGERAKAVGLEVPKETDKASPEYQDFLAKLKEAEESAAAKKEDVAAEEKQEEVEEKVEAPKSEFEKKKETLVNDSLTDIHEIWNRTYKCQEGAIYIGVKARKMLEECDLSLAMVTNTDRVAISRTLGEKTVSIKSSYDELVGSKDVENLRKGMSFIKSKGRSMIRKIRNSLSNLKREENRRLELLQQEQEEKERQAKAEADRLALVAAECESIKERFLAIVSQGCFRQLDWDSAYRMLRDTSSSFKTPEGELAAKAAAHTVDMMKSVQDIFIKNAKGHVFRGALRGATIVELNKKDIMILKPNSKQKQRIQWQKFYADYPGNLNELINQYIVKGRQTSKLNLKEWADAMLGSALTMKLVCPEVNGALQRAMQLAKEVISQYPDYLKAAKLVFPEMTADDAAEAGE